jgi:hypothetical protein
MELKVIKARYPRAWGIYHTRERAIRDGDEVDPGMVARRTFGISEQEYDLAIALVERLLGSKDDTVVQCMVKSKARTLGQFWYEIKDMPVEELRLKVLQGANIIVDSKTGKDIWLA